MEENSKSINDKTNSGKISEGQVSEMDLDENIDFIEELLNQDKLLNPKDKSPISENKEYKLVKELSKNIPTSNFTNTSEKITNGIIKINQRDKDKMVQKNLNSYLTAKKKAPHGKKSISCNFIQIFIIKKKFYSQS